MRRSQFSIRALLIATLATGCFFGGIHFEQRRKLRDTADGTGPAQRGVQTVYVRVANAAALPGDRGKQLADAIRSQIETKSPYKATNVRSGADSELVCTISAEGHTQYGRERFLIAKWVDKKGADLQTPLSIRIAELSDDQTIDRAAMQVMNMIESAW